MQQDSSSFDPKIIKSNNIDEELLIESQVGVNNPIWGSEDEEEYPCLSATLRYRVLSGDSFDKPDIFPTTITSCSPGQKAGLTQSSSA